MKQKIEALSAAFSMGVDYALHHRDEKDPHRIKMNLKAAIEKGLIILAQQEDSATKTCHICKVGVGGYHQPFCSAGNGIFRG